MIDIRIHYRRDLTMNAHIPGKLGLDTVPVDLLFAQAKKDNPEGGMGRILLPGESKNPFPYWLSVLLGKKYDFDTLNLDYVATLSPRLAEKYRNWINALDLCMTGWKPKPRDPSIPDPDREALERKGGMLTSSATAWDRLASALHLSWFGFWKFFRPSKKRREEWNHVSVTYMEHVGENFQVDKPGGAEVF